MSVSKIYSKYDAFIIDLWGVIHDGITVFPKAIDCLKQLRKHNKKIVFLSNSPRTEGTIVKLLSGFGIVRDLYDGIVTSGMLAQQYCQNNYHETTNCYIIGDIIGESIIKNSNLVACDDISQAGLLLAIGVGNSTISRCIADLEIAQKRNISMICANPDIEIVRASGERISCAGKIAHIYQEMGGHVIYFGKPYTAVYDSCKRILNQLLGDNYNILAIGDSYNTDINGAENYGVDSCLILSGIADSSKSNYKRLVAKLKYFSW